MTCFKLEKRKGYEVCYVLVGSKFDETVTDLKVWDKWYFLVIVELAIRVCATIEVYNKLSPTIIKGLFKISMLQRTFVA